MAEDWSDIEVEIIVADYFAMLSAEIAGIPYNKAEHRRKISPLLNNRPDGSIEFKHQNISAVLAKFGAPWIVGYKPRWNYQHKIENVVTQYLRDNPNLENSFLQFAGEDISHPQPVPVGYHNFIEEAPEPQLVREPQSEYQKPIKVNYLELEQSNKNLGDSGEQFVINYERWRLVRAGKDLLADKIEWIAQTEGSYAGYDILSKNTNGTDRYIEVKTTKLGKDAPIFFSKNEYEFSKLNSSSYFLYRLFNFKVQPKAFILNGRYEDFCRIEPINFKGIFDKRE
jgi:Domain of unknown function (DUF3883)